MKKPLLTVIFLLCAAALNALEVPMAVVESKYDHIEKDLKAYGLEYDMIKFKDLEDEGTYSRYRVIFIPCGAGVPIEESLNVIAAKSSIKSVDLKKDFLEIDKARVYEQFKKYIRKGGLAYVSGFAYDIVQGSFGSFRFFDGFPYMGLAGPVRANFFGDLRNFNVKKKFTMQMSHTGWVALRSASGADILARGRFETPRGEREGPLCVYLKKEDGAIIYTGYHEDTLNDFRRFCIYRLAGNSLISGLAKKAERYSQGVTGRIADAMQEGEHNRTYRVELTTGMNSIYFHSEKDTFQIDIRDENMALVESRDIEARNQIFDINTLLGGVYYVRVFPSGKERSGVYAIVTANGLRLFPHAFKVLYGIGIFIGLVFLGWLINTFGAKRYSGRFHLKKKEEE